MGEVVQGVCEGPGEGAEEIRPTDQPGLLILSQSGQLHWHEAHVQPIGLDWPPIEVPVIIFLTQSARMVSARNKVACVTN